MSITIRINDTEATIDDLEWSSDDEVLLMLCRSVALEYSPVNYDPYPDATIADMAIERLGGEIVHADDPPELPPGAIP